jgi:hypothetical protein
MRQSVESSLAELKQLQTDLEKVLTRIFTAGEPRPVPIREKMELLQTMISELEGLLETYKITMNLTIKERSENYYSKRLTELEREYNRLIPLHEGYRREILNTVGAVGNTKVTLKEFLLAGGKQKEWNQYKTLRLKLEGMDKETGEIEERLEGLRSGSSQSSSSSSSTGARRKKGMRILRTNKSCRG